MTFSKIYTFTGKKSTPWKIFMKKEQVSKKVMTILKVVFNRNHEILL